MIASVCETQMMGGTMNKTRWTKSERDVENVETGVYDCLSGSEPQEYHISATEESRLRQKRAVCRSVGAVYFCNCSERGQL